MIYSIIDRILRIVKNLKRAQSRAKRAFATRARRFAADSRRLLSAKTRPPGPARRSGAASGRTVKSNSVTSPRVPRVATVRNACRHPSNWTPYVRGDLEFPELEIRDRRDEYRKNA